MKGHATLQEETRPATEGVARTHRQFIASLPGEGERDGVVESIALLPTEQGGDPTYDVAVSLDEAITGSTSSISGLSVQVHVVVGAVRDALFVPREAIYLEGGRPIVRMLDAAGFLQDSRVVLGKGNALWVQIISGAEEGNRVVLNETASGNEALTQALAPATGPSVNSTHSNGSP